MSESPGTIRVLHVDDDPGFADLTVTLLEREGDRIEVETATNPEDGLAALADDGIDCVVSDYDMPRMDGIEFLQAVRDEDPDLPFILFTGKGSEEVASEAISAGVSDYLQKGSGTDQYALLANKIANAFDEHDANLVEKCWTTVETADASLDVESEAVVHADESRLKQLFENLVRNAIEHGGRGFSSRTTGPAFPKKSEAGCSRPATRPRGAGSGSD